MKTYNITVNGQTYEVEVEEVGAPSAPVRQAASAPAPAPVKREAPKAAAPKAAPAPVASGSGDVVSPMPGTILDIKVAVGDSVNEGDLVAILEAMKMENEIFAPVSGTVKSISANKGASVNSNDLIMTIG